MLAYTATNLTSQEEIFAQLVLPLFQQSIQTACNSSIVNSQAVTPLCSPLSTSGVSGTPSHTTNNSVAALLDCCYLLPLLPIFLPVREYGDLVSQLVACIEDNGIQQKGKIGLFFHVQACQVCYIRIRIAIYHILYTIHYILYTHYILYSIFYILYTIDG